jgi:predicted TIM-barrel enzyme
MEVTCRTVGGLALLRPSRKLPEIIAGVLGRALELSPLEICGLSFVSNHYHALLYADSQQAISRFMAHVQCNLAKEVGRHVGWKGSLWSRRYDGIIVSREPEAQWARLAYVLANGTKEGLVESPLEWPGLHAARYLITGEPIIGYWLNRTREWAATRRGEDFGTYDYATRYEIPLAPLPCARHLSPDEYQNEVIKLIAKIQDDCAKARDGRPVAGVDAVMKQNPFERPTAKRPKRSPKPRFHVASKEPLDELEAEFAEFNVLYDMASEALRSGDLSAAERFPPGCFPPALAFIGPPPPPRPPRPPTRTITVSESAVVEKGPIPVIVIPRRWQAVEPKARGQPP